MCPANGDLGGTAGLLGEKSGSWAGRQKLGGAGHPRDEHFNDARRVGLPGVALRLSGGMSVPPTA